MKTHTIEEQVVAVRRDAEREDLSEDFVRAVEALIRERRVVYHPDSGSLSPLPN